MDLNLFLRCQKESKNKIGNAIKSMANEKILIIDDDLNIIRSISFVLEREDYIVITAADGKEALEKAKEELPNLIILDIMLPELNGFEVCKLLKADTRTREIRIIVLTAKGDKKNERLSKELGVDAYMTKPFSINMLLLEVKKILDKD